MKRIFIETQSNRLFRGDEMQQAYDQRGGLCQVGEGHAIVTTNPVDPAYIDYWKDLGFTIPHAIVAGPFDLHATLAELILQKKDVQQAIKAFVRDTPARLEFFYVEGHEAEVSRVLGIPAYCNFEVSRWLAQKIPFKDVCTFLGLPTTPWCYVNDQEQLWREAATLIEAGKQVLVKSNDGSGGIAAGGMFKVVTFAELEEAKRAISHTGLTFLIEPILTNVTEVSCHWEILEDGQLVILGIFDRIIQGFSYCGGSYPATLPDAVSNLLISHLRDKLGPYLVQQGGKGYFHCDILISEQGLPLWTDFNPRKGGLIYIWDMIRRFAAIHFRSAEYFFWHETVDLPSKYRATSFSAIARTMGDLLDPGSPPLVILTNPGIIRFGHLDLTGVSRRSREEARQIVAEVKQRFR